jgi:hypothetical protein
MWFGLLLLVPEVWVRQSDTPNLIPDGDFSKPLTPEWETVNLKVAVLDSPKNPKRRLRLDSTGGGSVIRVKTSSMVHLGNTVYFRAMARVVGAETTVGHLHVLLRGATDTDPILDRKVQISSKWKEYKFAVDTKNYYLPGDLVLSIDLATDNSMELYNVRLLDMGDVPAGSLPQSLDKPPGLSKGTLKADKD